MTPPPRRSRFGAFLLGAALLMALPAQAGHPAGADHPPRLIVSIVGTNDLHGHLENLPRFAGYLANLRRARQDGGGGVVLLDAGDMFQGTLESNANEGAAVVRAYNALKYDAIAIGNHDFDYGPVGPATGPRAPGEDPRGALKARAAEAHFPFLAANLIDEKTGATPAWRNVGSTHMAYVGDVKVGIIGLANAGTAFMTLPANFAGLRALPLAPVVIAAAKDLRRQGAAVVVVVGHVGGSCTQFTDPDDLASCDGGSEIFQLARALPKGTIDAIVAGHTHAGIAHRVAGVPIIETYDKGASFGRIDIELGAAGSPRRVPQVIGTAIHRPEPIAKPGAPLVRYEGADVLIDPAVDKAIEPAVTAARARRALQLGVTVAHPIAPAYAAESALGNLFADLMRAARPKADVALTSGGSLRAALPAGALTYGQLHEALPFDDRMVTLHTTGADLAATVARNLGRPGGVVSLSGVSASAACIDGSLQVTLKRADGKPVAPAEALTLVTSEYLASGGSDVLPAELRAHADPADGEPIRDVMADLLRARKKPLDPDSPPLYDAAHPRLGYPGKRPVHCH
jgi:5'-nucleotidase